MVAIVTMLFVLASGMGVRFSRLLCSEPDMKGYRGFTQDFALISFAPACPLWVSMDYMGVQSAVPRNQI